MKYITLSFDDGRKDFFTNALPILKKYNLPATLNIVSDYIGRSDLSEFASGNHECLSWDEVRQCQDNGIEIANHSANHTNDIAEIVRGQKDISEKLAVSLSVGFASPNSVISSHNWETYKKLLKEMHVKYIRSGNQIKRDGLLYALLYLSYKYTKSKSLFYLYNRRNVIALKEYNYTFFRSVTCNMDSNALQVIHFVEKMPDDSAAILMFHSILCETDPGFEKDKWFNTVQDFERICSFLAKKDSVCVVSNDQLCNIIKKQGI